MLLKQFHLLSRDILQAARVLSVRPKHNSKMVSEVILLLILLIQELQDNLSIVIRWQFRAWSVMKL